ncbi:MAG: hypothetical protein AAFV33_14330 [Chloroflexota bacterium]
MIDEPLIDALNDCIDLLAAGETIEVCLSRYPDRAADLRPMLEAGLLTRRISADLPAVDTAKGRVRQRLEEYLGPPPFLRPWVLGLVLLSLVFGAAIGSSVTIIRRPAMTAPPPATVPVIVITATSPPITAIRTITPTVTRPPTVTQTRQPAATQIATTTPPPTEMLPASSDPVQITIEGPVTAIAGNIVTIFDQMLTLPAASPALTVLQIGDTIRVEAEHREGETIIATVTFISVEVIIDGERAWRDSGTCENPPPDWVQEVDGGTAWLLRCTGSSGGASGTAGNENDNRRDDSDNDDDD